MAIIWINRKWQDVSASGIPLNDRGLLHGCAAFETMRVVDGRVQHLEKHRARLEATSKALSLPSVELLDLLEIIGLLCEKKSLCIWSCPCSAHRHRRGGDIVGFAARKKCHDVDLRPVFYSQPQNYFSGPVAMATQ